MNDEGLMKVFSNKFFLTGLLIVVIISIGFYKRTEEQVKNNDSIVSTYDTRNIEY